MSWPWLEEAVKCDVGLIKVRRPRDYAPIREQSKEHPPPSFHPYD